MEDSYDERYDFDGAERSLESFVIQLFEFLLPVVRSPTFVKVVIHNVKELVYYTIGFLQMAEQQLSCFWDSRISQPAHCFILTTAISAGSLLLAEISNYCGMEGVDAVIDSIERRISESQQQKDNGAHVWWILREAALFALASVSEQLFSVKDSAPKVAIMLEQILTDE